VNWHYNNNNKHEQQQREQEQQSEEHFQDHARFLPHTGTQQQLCRFNAASQCRKVQCCICQFTIFTHTSHHNVNTTEIKHQQFLCF
jgi:hypothetical protein